MHPRPSHAMPLQIWHVLFLRAPSLSQQHLQNHWSQGQLATICRSHQDGTVHHPTMDEAQLWHLHPWGISWSTSSGRSHRLQFVLCPLSNWQVPSARHSHIHLEDIVLGATISSIRHPDMTKWFVEVPSTTSSASSTSECQAEAWKTLSLDTTLQARALINICMHLSWESHSAHDVWGGVAAYNAWLPAHVE